MRLNDATLPPLPLRLRLEPSGVFCLQSTLIIPPHRSLETSEQVGNRIFVLTHCQTRELDSRRLKVVTCLRALE